jgi:hypothetical protein
MRLDRKPAVGCGYEPRLRHADEFGHESSLIGGGADVLDDGVRMDDVERSILERQITTVSLDKRYVGVTVTQRV